MKVVESVKTVDDALKICKKSFLFVGLFSAVINLLMIVPPMYMLQVYDRVLQSGSMPTLWMLSLIMIFLLIIMGVLEWVRSQVLVRVSNHFDQLLSDRLYRISMQQALYSGGSNIQAQPLKDLLGLRQFLTGSALFAFFDVPWLPLYIFVMFLLNPLFGYVALGAAVVLLLVAWVNEKTTSPILALANKEQSVISAQTGKTMRNAEVIHAMGMFSGLREIWSASHLRLLSYQADASQLAGFFIAFSKTLRLMVMGLIMGTGAYLAVNQLITPGLMIAGSILLGRALAPVDSILGAWKQFVMARGQYERLNKLLEKVPLETQPMQLPDPEGKVVFDDVCIAPPGKKEPLTQIGSFALKPGVTAVIGPSAAGKSTLVRALLGIWPLARGVVRLDGADIHRWDRNHLGQFLGYLPQDIELFEGSIATNIARFGEVNSDLVVEAAKLAGVHNMILKLPQGYDTDLGVFPLSAGQRQRVALARAVYGNPKLVVLDEPNSNLDEAGEQSLAEAVTQIKKQGGNVVVVSHRTSILQFVDSIIFMADGAVKMMGPRDQILQKLTSKGDSVNNVTPIPAAMK